MDYQAILSDIFRNKSADAIENIIRIVRENCSDSDDIKLDTMIDLLSHTGNPDKEQFANGFKEEAVFDNLEGPQLDEAAGIDWDRANKIANEEKWDTLSRLVDMLPNADPSYLEEKARQFGNNEEGFEDFVTDAIENTNYPTREEYLKRKNEKTERQQYTTNFHLYEFLKEYPDPFATFQDPNRQHALSNAANENKEQEVIDQETKFALTFLQNTFRNIRKPLINNVFDKCQHDVVKTATKLRKLPPSFKRPRELLPQVEDLQTNLTLLKELAFVAHFDELQRVINAKRENIANAKELGILQSCSICYFDELIPEECYICSNECVFCRDCVKRGIEIAIAEEKLEMGCLSECGGDYSLTTLQMVLDRKTFAHFWQKKQLYEIEKAQIDGLEFCCLCYKFAYIPNPDDKIFSCTVCNKDSCRKCKHEAHPPFRCNEIEYDEDVKMRTYIENKMTEALLRKCYKCGKQFIKSTGCNKIVCGCGAKMCYLCNQPISDYDHFKNQKCPLFTDDNLLHLENVKDGAAKAKADLGVDKNPEILKFDPAKDL